MVRWAAEVLRGLQVVHKKKMRNRNALLSPAFIWFTCEIEMLSSPAHFWFPNEIGMLSIMLKRFRSAVYYILSAWFLFHNEILLVTHRYYLQLEYSRFFHFIAHSDLIYMCDRNVALSNSQFRFTIVACHPLIPYKLYVVSTPAQSTVKKHESVVCDVLFFISELHCTATSLK